MGYHTAFPDAEIVGVDVAPQPDYPFTFVQADARTHNLKGYDLIHASPPCQSYSSMSNRHGSLQPELVYEIRERMPNGVPSVIENVVGASEHMDTTLMLCGTMFDLPTRRHRLFECSFLVWQPQCGAHTRDLIPVYGKPDGRRLYTRSDGSQLRAWRSVEQGQRALGISWTEDWHQIREAIPPSYTQYIGSQL